MKKIFNNILWLALSLLAYTACSPEGYDSVNVSGLPKISEASVSISVAKEKATFHLDNKDLVPVWIFTNGDKVDRIAQNDYVRSYALPGDYSVEVKLYNKNGYSDGSVTKQFKIESTPTLTYLTGSGSKTWIWDKSVAGHFGCGASGGDGLGWWKAGANEKAGTGMYDDELTFTSQMGYTFNPGPDGKIYVNKDSKYKAEYYGKDGNDYDAPCDLVTTTFKFQQDGSTVYIVLPQNTMLSYIPNPEALTNPKYKILSLTNDLLELAVDNGGIAWHYRFIPKSSK
ncbi:MAG TPA: hypothetical protein VHO90_04085 [Bacteroidales bacterium]|nr:hypothetical protein [Bacteroidales bacterium]